LERNRWLEPEGFEVYMMNDFVSATWPFLKEACRFRSGRAGMILTFLSKLPGSSGPRYETHSQWMSVVRARQLAAAYSSDERLRLRDLAFLEGGL
jgi:hypothetical protein